MKPSCYFIATSWLDLPVCRHFKALAGELAARGHRVVVLIDHCMTEAEAPEANPAIYTWPSPRPTRLRDARFLARLIRRHRPACTIANFGAENVFLVVSGLMRVPCRICWYHTLSSQLELDCPLAPWKLAFLRARKRLAYRAATHFVANSRASRDDLVRVFGVPTRKCQVFPLGLAALPAVAAPESGPRPHRLVCVGRLHPSKGQDVLLRAAVLLKPRIPDLEISFIGDGPCKEPCLQLARELGVQEMCTFRGSLPHEEVLQEMAAATATVVPSRSEAFGYVNVESLAVGTPVVASAVGGIVEMFDDGEEGYLVASDDPPMLADRLARLLCNPELRRTMSIKARQRFRRFDQARVVREQADWLEQVTG